MRRPGSPGRWQPLRTWVRVAAAVALCLGAAAAGAQSTPNSACMDCHSDPQLVRDAGQPAGSSVFVDPARLEGSVHAGMNCVDCHTTATDAHAPELPSPACADCHSGEAEAFQGSLHGVALKQDVKDAPTCADCHGGHGILPGSDARSRVHPQQIPQTCAQCHANTQFIDRRALAMGQPLDGYLKSVHYKALQEGRHGATCTDCHESHELHARGDPRSAIYAQRVPATCGRCHGQIQQAFDGSVHGRALAQGNLDSPSCVDCHGEHEIRAPQDPLSRVYPAAVATQSCGQCHGNVALAARYGMDADRVTTYQSTYHGLAVQEGSVVTANCASCHGVHNILPSSDSKSTINPNNLQYTCGTCHEGATRQFAAIPVHTGAGTGATGSRWSVLLRTFYIWMIVVLLGGMLLHNAVIWLHAVVRKYRETRAGKTYVRLDRFQVVQHATLILSFTTLVITGFALKFPDAWWVAPLSWGGMGEQARRIVHRVAGVAMVVQSIIYTGYMVFTRRGRRELVAMLPRLKDVRDLRENVLHHLGRATAEPSFARFSYIEKAEFWAVVWGTVIMGATGLTLWFPEIATRFLPGIAVNLAEIVHYYEAWLATLAIVVWHFFYVIFYPGEYPVNLTVFDGRITEDALAAHHPLEYQQMQQTESRRTEDGKAKD